MPNAALGVRSELAFARFIPARPKGPGLCGRQRCCRTVQGGALSRGGFCAEIQAWLISVWGARRQSNIQGSVDLTTPIRGNSGSNRTRQSKSSGAASVPASKSETRDVDGVCKANEEACFIEQIFDQEKLRRKRSGSMIKGQKRYTMLAQKVNAEMHDLDPEVYIKKEWKQIKNKEHNLKDMCRRALYL